MHDLEIRRVEKSDLSDIQTIEQKVHKNPWSAATILQSVDRLSGNKHTEQIYKDAFVALKSQRVVGYLFYSKIFEEVELTNIAVDSDFQGQSIGHELLTRLKELALETQSLRILLEVRSSNTNAIRLYKNAGFVQTSLRKNYYPMSQGREDAILMTLNLA